MKRSQEIELEYGKPMKEILLELLNQGKTQEDIAELWGVSQYTVSYHVKRHGIKRTVKAIYTASEGGEHEPQTN